MTKLINDNEYFAVLDEIKAQIRTAQRNAVLAVNSEGLSLYWGIGNQLNQRKSWGNKYIENLARDIKLEFPESTGYSFRNLKYMAQFAKMFPEFEFGQVPLAQITWYHIITLSFYCAKTRTI